MILKYLTTILGVFFWIVFIPVTIAYISLHLTQTNYIVPSAVFLITGSICSIAGLLISLWAVLSLIILGKGTPIPIFGPQNLIKSGPYKYCRNPMTLGLLLYYIGAGIIFNNYCVAAILLIIVFAHMLYDKYYEEKKLTQTFGNNYLHYKHTTPFILPKLR